MLKTSTNHAVIYNGGFKISVILQRGADKLIPQTPVSIMKATFYNVWLL